MWTTDKGRAANFPYLEISGPLSQEGGGIYSEEVEHFLPPEYKKIKTPNNLMNNPYLSAQMF